MCAIIIETVTETEVMHTVLDTLINQYRQDKEVLHRVFVPILVAANIDTYLTEREAARLGNILCVATLAWHRLVHATDEYQLWLIPVLFGSDTRPVWL